MLLKSGDVLSLAIRLRMLSDVSGHRPEVVAHQFAHADRVDADRVVAAGVVARRVGDDLDEVPRRVVDVEDVAGYWFTGHRN